MNKNFRPAFERKKVQNSKSSNTDLEPETTGLSAYLNFGALSVRTLWYAAVSVDDEQTAVTVHGQLLYREFFYCVAFTVSTHIGTNLKQSPKSHFCPFSGRLKI